MMRPCFVLAGLTLAHCVCIAGSTAATLRVPQNHATISGAYAASARGDEIVVAPGVYRERMALNRFGVTTRSEAGPSESSIDAEFLGGVFVVNPLTSTEAFVVEGFTIRNGRRTQGGAFEFVRAASLTLRDCIVERNEATGGTNQGGAIYAPDFTLDTLTIEGCVFQDNFAGGPGFLPKGGAIRVNNESVAVFRDTEFRRNVPNACVMGSRQILVEDCEFSDQQSGLGIGECENLVVRNTRFLRHDTPNRGPISIQPGTTALFEDCLFEDNRAQGVGGASEVEEDAHATYRRCVFRGNVSNNSGGAVVLLPGSSGVFEDCLFENNVSGASSPGGGAVAALSAQAEFRRCVFRANDLDDSVHGAAIGFDGNANNFGGTRALIEDCDFIANGGSTIRIEDHSEVTIVGSRFIGNAPEGVASGGAIWIDRTTAPVVIANSLFTANRTDGNASQKNATGGAIQARSVGVDLDITIVNCAFVGNIANEAGGAIYNRAGANPKVINCVFVDNTPRDIVQTGGTSAIPISHSVLAGGWEGEGNVDGIALFVDDLGPDGVAWTGDEDYTPAPGSPAIDMGDTPGLMSLDANLIEDLEGNPRAVDAVRYADLGIGLAGENGIVDAGPVEAPAGLLSPCLGDADGDLTVNFVDLQAVVSDFGAEGGFGSVLLGDVNADGKVDFADLNTVLSAFGIACPAK